MKKIYLITNGHPLCQRVLDNVQANSVSGVFYELNLSISFHIKGTHGPLPIRLMKSIRRILISIFYFFKFYVKNRFRYKIINVGKLNSAYMLKKIKKEKPNYLILCGIGILSQNILENIKEIIINCHPGLLPYLRGSGVIEHAILKRMPIFVTLHSVCAKVDTGFLISEQRIETQGLKNIKEIKYQADKAAVSMLVSAIQNIMEGKQFNSETILNSQYPVLRNIFTKDEVLEMQNAVSSGVYSEAAEKWVQSNNVR